MGAALPTMIACLPLLATIASAAGRDSDPKAIAAVVEPLIAQAMTREGIPGAVFLFVKDGRTVHANGIRPHPTATEYRRCTFIACPSRTHPQLVLERVER